MITLHNRMVIEKWRRTSPTILLVHKLKCGKNDKVDAEAICEAVTRPTKRFVPVKSAEQQSILMPVCTENLDSDIVVMKSAMKQPMQAKISPEQPWPSRSEN